MTKYSTRFPHSEWRKFKYFSVLCNFWELLTAYFTDPQSLVFPHEIFMPNNKGLYLIHTQMDIEQKLKGILTQISGPLSLFSALSLCLCLSLSLSLSLLLRL